MAVLLLRNAISINRLTSIMQNSTIPATLYYFPILGQSQAGGFNTDPSLTTSSMSNVYTLTNGPIDASISGSLVLSLEGDDFTDTNGGGPSPDAETIATSFAQQLKTFRNDETDIYVVSVHARGGETIQALSKGGSTGRYEQITASVQNVKTICDNLGYTLITHPIFFHGGTGDNVGDTYKNKVLKLHRDFQTDIAAITGQSDVYMFTHQQRIIGSPDYGKQQYEASVSESKIVVVGPEYPLLLGLGGGVTYQGDLVHITNHGTRYLAGIWAQSVYNKLFGSGYRPLEFSPTSSFTLLDSNELVIPISNSFNDNILLSGSGSLEIYSGSTRLYPSITSSENNLILDFRPAQIGTVNMTFNTGLSASGSLRSVSPNTSYFLNSSSQNYSLDKYIVRATYTGSIDFPVNYILNFGGVNPIPDYSYIYTIFDGVRSFSPVTYSIVNDLQVATTDTSSSYWGFTSIGANKAGDNASTGINYYPTGAVDSWWFVESKSGSVVLDGLDTTKTYRVMATGLRPGTATERWTRFTIGDETYIRKSNRTSTNLLMTTDVEAAIFPNVAPDAGGRIKLTVGNAVGVYGYLSVLELRENPNGIIGSIFEESAFSDTIKFPIVGTGIARATNKLSSSGNPTLFSSYVYYNDSSSAHQYTGLEYWKQRVRIKTPDTITATSYGLGIGVKSRNDFQQYSTYVRWSTDTGGPGSLGTFYLYTQDSTSGQILSTGSYAPTANTYYWLEVERVKNAVNVAVYSDSGSLLYTEYLTSSLVTGYAQLHNVGQFTIHHFGGTNNEITSWSVSSNEAKGLDYCFMGDSNSYGLFSTASSQRWIDAACRSGSKTFSVSAGISETVSSSILKLPEIKALQPKNVFISLGRNDISAGTSLSIITGSLNTIVNELTSSGINVKLGGVIASTVDVTQLQAYYDTLPYQKVNFFSASKAGAGTTLSASLDSGDNIHLSHNGHQVIGSLASNIL